MKHFFQRLWIPLLAVLLAAAQTVGMDVSRAVTSLEPAVKEDTIIYKNKFKKGLVLEQFALEAEDSLATTDTLPHLTARDTLHAPDSLKYIDPFRYKYYVALKDSLTHIQVRDSLKAAGDSIDWPRLDSLYYADSLAAAKAAFAARWAQMSKLERKKYLLEQRLPLERKKADSILALKDSLKAIRDSIIENTPRVLQTFALPDSMQYKRIVMWTHERHFHKMDIQEIDTTADYRYNDYPFLREDVNATWLGVAGSAVQSYNFFRRKNPSGVSFYQPYESWTYSPETLPMYNTKTPYTELAYSGTLFANMQTESNNLHILTTQNIWPAFNFTLEYNLFSGNGILQKESTTNKTFTAHANYLGKRYLAHGGYIYNMVSRQENGGIRDNMWIRDTTVDAREIDVFLAEATTNIKRHTFFLDQQYRIPFNFIEKLRARRNGSDTLAATRDTLLEGHEKVTTAFIGHSSEYSVYRKTYNDKITDEFGKEFYHGIFNYHPNTSADSVRVMKLENRLFLRLQPWGDEDIISKVDGGIGNRILNYYLYQPDLIRKPENTQWNSTYVYAGAQGQLRDFIHWDAQGEYTFAGQEANDLNISANAQFNLYPFRRARKSPLQIDLHFSTDLDEPEFYHQHYYSNHYRWENDFDKISTTRIEGRIRIPHWKLEATAGYAFLKNNIFYDTTGVIRQNTSPMSVFSASVRKHFTLFDLLHFDNRVLFQVSSNQYVMPMPTLALNLRYYIQFNIQKVLQLQIGANGFYNTPFYSPDWNPAVGAFQSQEETKYTNGPYIDAFINMQWKRACIFVKVENIGQGWPMNKFDYFSAHHYIRTQTAVKVGIYWPFYLQPHQHKTLSERASGNLGGGSGSGGGSGLGGMLGGMSGGVGGMMGGMGGGDIH